MPQEDEDDWEYPGTGYEYDEVQEEDENQGNDWEYPEIGYEYQEVQYQEVQYQEEEEEGIFPGPEVSDSGVRLCTFSYTLAMFLIYIVVFLFVMKVARTYKLNIGEFF